LQLCSNTRNADPGVVYAGPNRHHGLMFTVIVLTICAGWCLVSIAAALLIGAAVERRDADLGCGDGIDVLPPQPEAPVSEMPTVTPLIHAQI